MKKTNIPKRTRKEPKTVIFWKDEGNLYTAPYTFPGSRQVLPEEFKKAQETKTVIIVSHEEVKPGV